MYRLATKCTTKKRSEKRHNCLWTQATRTHESNMHGSFVNNDTQRAGRGPCSRGVRTADADLLADADPQ